VAHLEPGEDAGDQEADRSEDVGAPDVVPRLRRAHGGEDGSERADVELEGPHELHGGRLPVDLAGQEHEDLTAIGAGTPGRGINRLAVLQEAGRGEEQRADEERQRVGPRAHGVHVRGHRAQCEQDRADGEEHPYPPVAIVRRPPRRAASRVWMQVLAVGAGFPVRDHAVGPLADDEGDERPEPAFLYCFGLRRHQGRFGVRVAAHSYLGWGDRGRAASPSADEVTASRADAGEVRLDPLMPGQQPAQVVGALPDVGDRAFAAGILGQDGVLFQDVPAAVIAVAQMADDRGEIDVTAP